MGERVLVLGHGAREHALAHKLAYGHRDCGERVREVIVAGGNGGIALDFECVSLPSDDLDDIIGICKKISPDLIVIGPENYLAAGIKDRLQGSGLAVFGPSKSAAQLEASKYFAKTISSEAKIPTAKSERFDELVSAQKYVDAHPHEKIVIKADGLCAGKGVSVCMSKEEAMRVLDDLYVHDGFSRLGTTEKIIVIEDFLPGSEVSVFGLAHENDVVLFSPMQDHKRLRDNDQGPNTGGMGACGPLAENADERCKFLGRIKEKIFLPTLHTMSQRGQPFSGLLYAGLMLVNEQPYLLEWNVRFGDPETQALLFGTEPDIYCLLRDIATGQRFDEAHWQRELAKMMPTVSIVLASEGYPSKKSSQESVITLPSIMPAHTKIFSAAVGINENGELTAKSGRVMSMVARAPTVAGAQALGYECLRKINFTGMQYRKDIGMHLSKLSTEI